MTSLCDDSVFSVPLRFSRVSGNPKSEIRNPKSQIPNPKSSPSLYTVPMTSPADSSFHDRARWEAARYGADAWVFVRELLQNARDAGASRVWLETARVDGRDRLSCRDDGDGMSFEHAKRYLFTLYASSKRGRSRTAGRFGIGFWSVLRFAPDTLLVRSRPRRGPGWQVRLDAALEVQSVSVAAIERGTEVVLERAADGADISSAVRAAVLRDAPFLGRRDSADRPLEVRVDGEVVRAELMKMLVWHIGAQPSFRVNPGKSGKYFQRYLSAAEWELLVQSYNGPGSDETWAALRALGDLFHHAALAVAAHFGFEYPQQDEDGVRKLVAGS